jgi:hypothetical protein
MEKARSNPPSAQISPCVEAAAKASSQGPQRTRESPSSENRAAARYPVSADAVVIEARSQTRLRGRAADLSLSGCYLDAISLFAVGTSVGLRLTTEAHAFECEARVTSSLRGMGMGLVFTKVSPDQATELRRWIAELSGESGAAPSAFVSAAPEPRIDHKKLADDANPPRCQAALSELVSILRSKGLLDESEADVLQSKINR